MKLVAIPVLLLAISLAVELTLKLVAWLRERRQPEWKPPVSAGPNYTVSTFRVVALGGAGSGKTVFLSSPFHNLSYRRPGRSYHLETGAAQHVALGSLYSEATP